MNAEPLSDLGISTVAFLSIGSQALSLFTMAISFYPSLHSLSFLPKVLQLTYLEGLYFCEGPSLCPREQADHLLS